MKVVLLLLTTALLAAAVPRRAPRQTWSFPGEDENTRPDNRPPTRPTRRTTTTRSTTVAQGGTTSPTPSPNVIFQTTCPCPAPPQYNPVCGDDGSTYSNRQVLECARTCGANVQFVRLGVCATPRR